MEKLRTTMHLLLVLVSARTSLCQDKAKGFSCVNDYITNVTCEFNSSGLSPGVECRVHALRVHQERQVKRICDLRPLDHPGGSLRRCSVDFEFGWFSFYEKMPSIRVECGGPVVEEIINYCPSENIKLPPVGLPVISRTNDSETVVTWSQGDTGTITVYTYEVQVKHGQQQWTDAERFSPPDTKLTFPAEEPGQYQSLVRQVRVRVMPVGYPGSSWSEWSPVASLATKGEQAPDPSLDLWFWVMLAGLSGVAVLAVTVLVVKTGSTNGTFKCKLQPIPDPSKYFPALNSFYGGNFKIWLSSPSALEPFFIVEPSEDFSTVCMSDTCDTAPSSTPTSVLVHQNPGASSYQQASSKGGGSSSGEGSSGGGVNNRPPSSCSSVFYNLGYFFSGYPSAPLPVDLRPVHFTYQNDPPPPPHLRPQLHLSTSASRASSSSYEHLREEEGHRQGAPRSPDSGFGTDDQVEDHKEEDEKGEEELGRGSLILAVATPPLVLRPVRPPSPSQSPHPLRQPPSQPPSHPPSQPPRQPPSHPQPRQAEAEREASAVVLGGCYAAWPVEGTLGRAASMTVESNASGYLTVKELQTTYSNKSI